MSDIVWIGIAFASVVCIPAIAIFFYRVANDPATPGVLKQLSAEIRNRSFGYLGKQKKRVSRPNRA